MKHSIVCVCGAKPFFFYIILSLFLFSVGEMRSRMETALCWRPSVTYPLVRSVVLVVCVRVCEWWKTILCCCSFFISSSSSRSINPVWIIWNPCDFLRHGTQNIKRFICTRSRLLLTPPWFNMVVSCQSVCLVLLSCHQFFSFFFHPSKHFHLHFRA